ncbi:hypothetical protein M1466_00505 [Candidatus Dependentiae bacterium]|nr:hypothetical protein [Candidatus Dependentiae bacterium]
MNLSLVFLLGIIVWSQAFSLQIAPTLFGHTFSIARPLEQHRGLMALGMIDAINCNKTEPFTAAFACSIAAGRSFGTNLNTLFAGKNGTVTVGPGTTAKTSDYDIRASDLGLAQNFIGSMALQPISKNVLITFDFYAAWNELLAGLYSRVRIPLLWNRTVLQRSSVVTQLGDGTYGRGFVAPYTAGNLDVVYKTVPDALSGCLPFGNAPTLNNAILGNCGQNIFGLTYVHMDIGYNIALTEYYRLGVSLHAVTPAAPFTAPANFTSVFSPSIGQTHKGQLGGVIETNLLLLQDPCQELRIYAESMLCAVLPYQDSRSLGLQLAGTTTFNHYLLLKQYSTVNHSYQGLQRAANLLYQPIQLSASLNTDSMVMVQYTNQQWQVDVGVDIWTYSKERASLCATKPFSSQATTNQLRFVPKVAAFVQTGPDTDGGFYSVTNSTIITDGTAIPTVNAVTLTANQLLDSMVTAQPALMPSVYATSLFGGITHRWEHCYCPFLNIGFMVEWGKKNLVLNQWLIQIKAGISF